jgi:heterodisulfide reductase subunit A
MTRIGVFLCTCDQKINKSIDVDVVESEFREKPVFSDPTPLHYGGTGKTGFWTVTRMAHACLPDGIAALEQIIRENNLDRVVVAACPARFQEKHLCDACVKANVNVNHFALVDWREGCAWAHRGDKEGATAKAIDLVQMGIARVENAHALDGVLTKITPRVLVIGGGIAGMTAARTLADRGIAVTLVEQEAHLGGQLRGIPLDGMAPAYDETMLAVTQHPNIEVHLDSRVVAVNGSVGNYCVEMVSAASSNTFEIAAGAIVVATGAQEYREARLYRHDGRRVVTLSEFEIQNSKFKIQNSDLQPPISNLQPPTSLVYILCAGSRDAHIPYCSNVCCLGALHQAIRVKRANSDTRVTVLFRDL